MMNPIQYTNTDFQSVMNDINSDSTLIDSPDFWKRIMAGSLDVSGVIQNMIANQRLLRTAFTRKAVSDLCALIDYQLSPMITASGNLLFYLDATTVVFPASFSAADLKASTLGSITQSAQQWESRFGKTVATSSETFTRSGNTLVVARTYTTGEKVRVSSTITLPPPLASNTDYYVIYVSATSIYLATSLVNAYNGSYITLTGAGSGVHTITMYSFIQLCYQQKSLGASVILGTSDGTTAWQTFRFPDKYLLRDTLTITINSVPWTRVDSFIDSTAASTHYRLIYLQDGDTEIEFGNGTYGAIPGNFSVIALYAIGSLNSNVYVINKVSAYAGGHSYVNGVSNPAILTGGENEESIEDAKILAPLLLKARDRDITQTDGMALANAYSGVMRANIVKNAYGVLTQSCVVVKSGGGVAGAPLLTALATYLTDRTILESVYTLCVSATYYSIAPIIQVKILTGYTWATVQQYVLLALRLLYSEVTKEIIDTYNTDGITSAITYINTKWGSSFTASDNIIITRMIINVSYSDFGDYIVESDMIGFIDSYVEGVDYLIDTSGIYPITLTQYQTTNDTNVIVGNITQIP